MRSHLARELRIMTLIVVVLLALACWLDISHPIFRDGDTMAYKLKYVRLRAIHEEERERILRGRAAAESDSLEIELRKILMTVGDQ